MRCAGYAELVACVCFQRIAGHELHSDLFGQPGLDATRDVDRGQFLAFGLARPARIRSSMSGLRKVSAPEVFHGCATTTWHSDGAVAAAHP